MTATIPTAAIPRVATATSVVVVLDLKTKEGKETFERLVEETDILFENFTVRTMDRLGLSYERLRETNLRLI